MTDLSSWLEAARRALTAASDQPSLEAQAILGNLLGKSRAWIFGHPEAILSTDEITHLYEQVSRRISGVPLPYLLGRWEFYGLEFDMTPAVLIPRSETEQLVDLARDWLIAHPNRRRSVDVGTGSGCIAAALAVAIPNLTVVAVDTSGSALEIARRNLWRHHLADRVPLVQSDLLSALAGPFDLVCANLPYIPTLTMQELDVACYEPRLALDGGPDGLRLIERLLSQLPTRLAPGGRVLLEIEFSEDKSAPTLARHYFPQARVELKTDLAGLPRLVMIDSPE
jgi:release factor glutamine methyltransferase